MFEFVAKQYMVDLQKLRVEVLPYKQKYYIYHTCWPHACMHVLTTHTHGNLGELLHTTPIAQG